MVLKFTLTGNGHSKVDITIDSVTSDWSKPIEVGDPVYITQTRSKDNNKAGFEYRGVVTTLETVEDNISTEFGHHKCVYKNINSHGGFVNI